MNLFIYRIKYLKFKIKLLKIKLFLPYKIDDLQKIDLIYIKL